MIIDWAVVTDGTTNTHARVNVTDMPTIALYRWLSTLSGLL